MFYWQNDLRGMTKKKYINEIIHNFQYMKYIYRSSKSKSIR